MGYDEELMAVAQADIEDHNRALELILQGADVNKTNFHKDTPLNWAALKGHYHICKTLLENGAQPNILSNLDETPLRFSLKHENILRLLLENGADPNFKTRGKGTAMDCALVKEASNKIIYLLIKHGADVNNARGNQNPLLWACEKRRKKLVELLLHKGASMEVRNNNNKRPVDIAKNKGFEEIVSMFEKDFSLWLRLYHAARQGNYEECEALLEQGAFVDSSQIGLYCPLTAASKKGHSKIVQLLLEKGATTKYEDTNNKSPVFWATKKGHKDTVSVLLDNGSKTFRKVNCEALLHLATLNNDEDMVHLLVQKGINPNIKDNEGYSPLHHAISHENTNLVHLLLKEDVNPNIKNKDGYTPLHNAIIKGNEDIVTCLIEHSANVNIASNKMETPLHLACDGGHQRIIEILLKNEVKTDVLNDKNKKPIDIINQKILETELKTKNKMEVLERVNELLKVPPKLGYGALALESAISDCGSENGSFTIGCELFREDSDSDATVDYSFCNVERNSSRLIFEIVKLNSKMDKLSDLILELNDKAANLALVETDLDKNRDALTHLDRELENNRILKQMKLKDLKVQLFCDDAIEELTRTQTETKQKKAELQDQVYRLQSDIPSLKNKVENVYLELAPFIEKIDMIFK